MNNNFLKLLSYSNKLKKENKSLRKENPEQFKQFLDFLVVIEENLHYLKKEEYMELSVDFLNDEISADDFSSYFMSIYENVNKRLIKMQENQIQELQNLLEKKTTNERKLNLLLARIYGACDAFSLDLEINRSSKKELKNYAKLLLLELQEK